MLRKSSAKGLALGAVVAALYVALCFLLQPVAYGPVQFRVSEALCVLPLFFPEAIPGLFIGCVLANVLGGYGVLDIVFGSLATLIAAALSYRFRKNLWVALCFPVVVNAVVIPVVLYFAGGVPLLPTAASIFISQAIICYGGGVPLYYLIKKTPINRLVG